MIDAEDRLGKESATSRECIEQLIREEMSAMMQRQDITKLGKFKDVLKLLLEKLSKQRKGSSASGSSSRKDR